MPSVEGCFRGGDNGIDADLGYDDFDFDFRQQRRIDGNAAVKLVGALLDAAAHYLCDGHARDAQFIQGFLQRIKFAQPHDDGYLVHTGVAAFGGQGMFTHNGHGGVHLCAACFGGVLLAEVGVGVHIHAGIGDIRNGKAGISGSEAVLVDIKPFNLHFGRYAQADGFVDDLKYDEHDNEHIAQHGNDAQRLTAQLAEAAAVKQPFVRGCAGGEQADGQRAPHAVCKVDGNRAHRVVYLGDVIEELHAEHHEDARDEADEEGAEGADGIAACGNGDQPRQRTVQRHGNIRLAVAHPCKYHRRAGGDGGGKVRVDAHEARKAGHFVGGNRDGGAAVEAEPAEPEDEHAQRGGGQIVAGDGARLAVFIVFADARPKHPRTQQRRSAADEMYGGGACKIMKRDGQRGKPASAPDPVAGDGVYQQADGCRVHAVGLEVCALGHRTGNDGGRRCAEDRLEDDIDPDGDAKRGFQCGIIAADKEIQPADERPGARKHQPEADEPITGCADAEIHHVLHQDIAGIFRAGKPCFTKRETRLHEVHEKGRDQSPYDVDGVVHVPFPSQSARPQKQKSRCGTPPATLQVGCRPRYRLRAYRPCRAQELRNRAVSAAAPVPRQACRKTKGAGCGCIQRLCFRWCEYTRPQRKCQYQK